MESFRQNLAILTLLDLINLYQTVLIPNLKVNIFYPIVTKSIIVYYSLT